MVFGAPKLITKDNLDQYGNSMTMPRYNIVIDRRDDAGKRLHGILEKEHAVLSNIDSWQVFHAIEKLLEYGDNISNILYHLRLAYLDDDGETVVGLLSVSSVRRPKSDNP